ACKCRGMDEDILSPAVLTDKTEPLVGPVHFKETNTFLRLGYDRESSGRALFRRSHQLNRTQIHLNDFGDFRTLLPLADLDLDARALGHVAVSRCLKLADVQECLGPSDHGDKSKALLGIEPFD